jgi:hypothetical protein
MSVVAQARDYAGIECSSKISVHPSYTPFFHTLLPAADKQSARKLLYIND